MTQAVAEETFTKARLMDNLPSVLRREGKFTAETEAWIESYQVATNCTRDNAVRMLRKMARRKQSGFSLIELLIVVAIILIIAAIAIPSLLKAKQASHESAATANLKTMLSGLVGYSEQCPSVGFPATLVPLGPGPGDCTGSNHLDSMLGVANPAKEGYNFTYTPGPAAPNGTVDSFTINADPWSANAARKHFFIDASGVIHFNGSAPATAADPNI